MESHKDLLEDLKSLPSCSNHDIQDALAFSSVSAPKQKVSHSFVADLHHRLVHLYSFTDKVVEYIKRKESVGMFPEHELDVVDVRIDPYEEHLAVWYTLILDKKVYRREQTVITWETFDRFSESVSGFVRNSYTLCTYNSQGKRTSGPIVRELSREEALNTLAEQARAFSDFNH